MSCSHASEILSVLGKKWISSIIFEISENKEMRFTDLKKKLTINSLSLTNALELLYKNGIIEKGLTVDVPIQSEYILTDFGKKIAKIVESLDELYP